MGLDVVELVCELEDQFGISIPDADVGRLVTVGAVAGYIAERAAGGRPVCCATGRSFYELRRQMLALLPLRRRDIRPDTALEQIIPRRRRRSVWRHLRKAGLKLPSLCLSWRAVAMTACAVAAITAFSAWHTASRNWPLWFIAYSLLAALVTRPLAQTLPVGATTVGEAALLLAKPPENSPACLTRAEVTQRVRLIISSQLAIPLEQLNDDTDLTCIS